MILNFEEYLKEGLWSKGLERAQTGEERQEELSAVDRVCLKISKIISNYLGIELNKNICTCSDFIDSNSPRYKIIFDIYGVKILKIVHVNKSLKDDYNHIGREITRCLFWTIKYDKEIPSFQRIIKVFEGIIDEMKEIFKEK